MSAPPHHYPQDLAIAGARWIGEHCVADGHALGERVIGAQVSLGHPPTQRHLGGTAPRIARLTERVLLRHDTLELQHRRGTRVTVRLALRLGRTLTTAPASTTELLAATDRVLPCLEITDQHALAALLIGDGAPTPAHHRLHDLQIQLRAGTTTTRAHPGRVTLHALRWLARQPVHGAHKRGQLLIGPTLTDAIELRPGTNVTARHPALGSVELRAVRRHRQPGSAASASSAQTSRAIATKSSNAVEW